jgi:hypothetical protein
MNAEERLAWLLETEWVPTNRQVLFADITAVVGLEATALVVGTMKAASATNPLMDTIIIAMSTNGLSLSTPERQDVIDQLAAAGDWPNEVRDAIKALGGVWRPRWQSAGYASEPTLEQVQSELATENAPSDETRHEVLLSVNRGTDGTMRVMARVTPVEFAAGVELRRGDVRTLVNDEELVAALSPIIEGLTDA